MYVLEGGSALLFMNLWLVVTFRTLYLYLLLSDVCIAVSYVCCTPLLFIVQLNILH